MKYKINHIFYTLQGEGYHAGKASIFIRFSDCNLRCAFCDTEFLTGDVMTIKEIIDECDKQPSSHIVMTGGEPGMRDLGPLVSELKKCGYYIQIETNGMYDLPFTIDWVTFSPKTKPESIELEYYHEIKVVIAEGDELPQLAPFKGHYDVPLEVDGKRFCWVSPMNPTHLLKTGTETCSDLDDDVLKYCINLVLNNPSWSLSCQLHKYWGVA